MMRALILVAAALAVTGCSNNDQRDNTMNVDENLTAENIVSNDVTAIDAVTGDAANMAEAAEINDFGPAVENSGLNMSARKKNSATATGKKPETPKADAKAAPKPAVTTPAGNTTE